MIIKIACGVNGKFEEYQITAEPIKLNSWTRKFAIHVDQWTGEVVITDVKTGLVVARNYSKLKAIKLAKERLKDFTESSFSKFASKELKEFKKYILLT